MAAWQEFLKPRQSTCTPFLHFVIKQFSDTLSVIGQNEIKGKMVYPWLILYDYYGEKTEEIKIIGNQSNQLSDKPNKCVQNRLDFYLIYLLVLQI